jgi:hypothetical protein
VSRFQQSIALAVVSLVLLSGIGSAESIDGKTGKLAQPAPKPETAPVPSQPRSDPTTPSDRLREAMEINKAGGGAAPKMPNVVLRGRVLVQDKPAVALIELDPKAPPVAVSKGTTLMSGSLKLKVTEVSATEVRIEVSPLNETIVLR